MACRDWRRRIYRLGRGRRGRILVFARLHFAWWLFGIWAYFAESRRVVGKAQYAELALAIANRAGHDTTC